MCGYSRSAQGKKHRLQFDRFRNNDHDRAGGIAEAHAICAATTVAFATQGKSELSPQYEAIIPRLAERQHRDRNLNFLLDRVTHRSLTDFAQPIQSRKAR